ncbi:MAG: ABC transporter permease [Acidobacteria bacterium]|nr:ABC transporter permease [Acidobacteriota bacterium]
MSSSPTSRDSPAGVSSILNLLGPLLGLILVLVLFSFLAEGFLSLRNFRTTLIQTVIVGFGSIGMTFVIVGGGIDLSAGSVIALSSVVSAVGLQAGQPTWLAIALGVLAGGLCGLCNGLCVAKLELPPFIATLGMFLVARGLAKYLAGNTMVRPRRETFVDALVARSPEPPWLLVAPAVWILFLLGIVLSIVLAKTVFGVHTYAVGSSEPTARLSGVPVARVKATHYVLSGLFAGLAGVVLYGRLGGMGDPTAAVGTELEIIAACVIGGASLSGGEGRIRDSLVGALLMSFLATGCRMMDIPNYVQEIVTGCIIVVAVTVDRLRHRSRR